ncbi:hypothetical protein GCM10009425_29220 [Pseudomonas asuensis]|uniref:HTH araC/xylS-type domain-containing protein n=1 Tax=Pseudomonas asuensis TaxID=1825787 RepID=A0ABQ2GW13_9PSED|nr:AraC family transcriptional regulator [Pseudomonas asuensis]GGM16445.1 hypothetical protein GCM10009425_29220 [Pseudomonas asuensis]
MTMLNPKLLHGLDCASSAEPDTGMAGTAHVLVRRLLETLDSVQDAAGPISRTLIDELQARLAPNGFQPEAPVDDRIALSRWQERMAKRLMIEQLDEGLSVSEIAQACSLSRSHFSRAFKKNTGLSPRDWYQQLRIAKAKRMLVNTDLPISQIGTECAFSDQSHFTRVFTKAVGCTPLSWRRSGGQQAPQQALG